MPANNTVKRLRVFAGPNGSGKSTIIEAIRKERVNGRPIDFGVYINADDIAQALLAHTFSFSTYQLDSFSKLNFIKAAIASGLINASFPESAFRRSFSLDVAGVFKLKTLKWHEHLAQVLATVIREELLLLGKKISLETVFSHPSKLEFMRRAKGLGYKVYLYFVATNDVEINIARIKEVRIKQGGHDVPKDKIQTRYKRSLELMFEASAIAWQAYFFDNSEDGVRVKVESFAHIRVQNGKQIWQEIAIEKVPQWFYEYYLNKLK